jgi:tetratricopeptide (TPR) repeat protein
MIDETVELDKTSYAVDLSQRMDCDKSEPGRNGDPLKISLKEMLVGPFPAASLLSVFNLTSMNTFSSAISILVILASSTFLRAQHHPHNAAEDGDAYAAIEKFGTLKMRISCAASVQVPFERGVALLHSFWYEEAERQFQAVASSNPRCAMAHWGLAMTVWRPFWDGMPDDRRKAGIVEIDKATALQAPTDRERRYIAALSGYLHADSSENEKALRDYDNAMSALHTAYPDDVEASAFYGLALAASIGTQDPVGDARKALAVLEPAFSSHPDHPGLAHYIIHTCDSPQLAHEALPAAGKYASIAPSSAHALHMPSHIFARLGMWQQDIDSNKASVRASEYAEKNHLGGVGHQLHAYEFLLYAYLQQADDASAERVLDHTEPMIAHLRTVPGIENDGMALFTTYFEVELPGIYYLELHNWKDVLAIPEPANSMASAKYYRAWEQAIAAGHLRNAIAADNAAERAESVYPQLVSDGSPISDEKQVAQETIKAWQGFAHKNDEEALRRISAAADMQDRVGGAEVDISAREMYADMLLVDNHSIEALAQYRTALKLYPNRFNGLSNAGRAAEAAGKPDEAQTYYKLLMKITSDGIHTQRPEIAYARNFLRSEH